MSSLKLIRLSGLAGMIECKKYPNSADAYENLGEVYMKAGNKLERIETFLKANKIYICFPHRIEISENLDISRGL